MIISGFVTIDGERRPAIFELDDVKPETPLRLLTALWIPHNNEWTLMQTPDHEDPVGIRFAGRNLGKGHISGNSVRADGKQEMSSLLQFKGDERERDNPHIHSGEVTLHCRDGRATAPGDDGMRFVQQWRHSETQIGKAVINHLVVNRVTLRGTEV